MPGVYAAMIEFDKGAFQGVSAAGYDAFGDAASRADALFNREANGGDIRILLAPEYFFSTVGATAKGSTTIGSMSSGNKMDIYKKLKRTSASYPDMLIVAGSIAYTKGGGCFSAAKHLSVCPILANGDIKLKYYKQSYDHFQTGSSDDTWDTKAYGSTFTHGGQKFGIEICLDHGNAKLKDSGAGLVDIQLLVSAGAKPMPSGIAARVGGLVINCDMSGKGGGNGITTVSSYAGHGGRAVLGALNAAVVRTDALGHGGQVTLYRGAI